MALPRMHPSPSEHLVRFVGDRLKVCLGPPDDSRFVRAFLRTNLTRARVARAEVVAKAGLRSEDALTFAGASWRDIPLAPCDGGWVIDLPLLEVGHFRAKAYCVDASGKQRWPEGHDLGISVHPDHLRSANTLYCAFPRTFGKPEHVATSKALASAIRHLDERRYSVIPPSGTLRGLTRVLPHVFDTLNCRILHLLPVGPVPTTYARMGRYGSPYAQLDLTGIVPALVEFDKRTNAVDQFRELADGVHLRSGLVLLDIVLNHTGWGSRLLDEHPEWFKRNADGAFHSPGAWGVVWEDLVELDQGHAELWDVLADALLTWCRRGVDGFRCDAGYMVPLAAWQYVVARVRQQFPDCVFLLEGLGGAFQATETLLTEGGMQWAYSELFQCYEPAHVARYLDHANHQSERSGLLVHYSETHDNDRLAARSDAWSRMRNHLCALASHSGGFGFSAGVEWLCKEKFLVHEARTLSWEQSPNLVEELGRLNQLLDQHPCFFDGARVERVSSEDSHVLALQRTSADGRDHCLVLVNLDVDRPRELLLSALAWSRGGEKKVDLLGRPLPQVAQLTDERVRVTLAPGESHCLAAHSEPLGMYGDAYRTRRAQAAFAYTQLGALWPHEALGPCDFVALGEFVAEDPAGFLGSMAALDADEARVDLLRALRRARERGGYPRVVTWTPADAQRVTLVPPDHWLLVRDERPFAIHVRDARDELHLRSTPVADDYVAAVPPQASEREGEVRLHLDRFGDDVPNVEATLLRLPSVPEFRDQTTDGVLLLVNGRGGMARLLADLGSVRSKYDCLVGANLHPEVPCDRHIFAKRARVWVNADGFVTALDKQNLVNLQAGPPAIWTFAANAGDGRQVGVRLSVDFVHERNTVVMRFERVPTASLDLPSEREVRLTLRVDLEDRSFHGETRACRALEERFDRATHALSERQGFAFTPAQDRGLRVWCDRGAYHPEREWTYGIHHAEESSRGLEDRGDAFSPGWFDLPLAASEPVTVVLSADLDEPTHEAIVRAARGPARPSLGTRRSFEAQLRRATEAFVVRRGEGRTVIAGYPWFLDWGRDTLIAVRGLIAAGLTEEARHIVLTFAGLEEGGTLPNFLSGEGTKNRETSDAPLWLALACEELAKSVGVEVYNLPVRDGRTLLSVLESIAQHMMAGTSHGVKVDEASGLVSSPPHYTWMDTNFPAATPREGYPIELSVLWFVLLRQLARMGREVRSYQDWADRVLASLDRYYRPDLGFYADTLHVACGAPASEAVVDDHLRPNHLLAVSLGLVTGERARQTVSAATRYLLVPGALRTLAPRPVSFALPVRRDDGTQLNNPSYPYWGRYEGDEDTRRKPAYHNGTAWVWWLPTYCEALARAYGGDPAAVAAARSILGSTAGLLSEGCLGQLPEILDGDAPHAQRGCDAQAWSVTETLRVWLALSAL